MRSLAIRALAGPGVRIDDRSRREALDRVKAATTRAEIAAGLAPLRDQILRPRIGAPEAGIEQILGSPPLVAGTVLPPVRPAASTPARHGVVPGSSTPPAGTPKTEAPIDVLSLVTQAGLCGFEHVPVPYIEESNAAIEVLGLASGFGLPGFTPQTAEAFIETDAAVIEIVALAQACGVPGFKADGAEHEPNAKVADILSLVRSNGIPGYA
jgi:hypothetical protein